MSKEPPEGRKAAFFAACSRHAAEVESVYTAFADSYLKLKRSRRNLDYINEYNSLNETYVSAKSAGRELAHEALVLPDGDRVEFRGGVGGPGTSALPPDRREKAMQAQDWLSARTRASSVRVVEVDWYTNPDPVEQGMYIHYSSVSSPRIYTNEVADVSAYIHELGHALERVGNTQARLDEFLVRRAGPDPRVYNARYCTPTLQLVWDGYAVQTKAGKAIPGPNSVHAERIRYKDPADWHQPDGSITPGLSIEVLGVGLQTLYRDPLGFAEEDREYCEFIIDILDGGGR